MKKTNFFLSLFLLILLTVLLCSCGGSKECSHDWSEANCVSPKTCKLCAKIEGEALGHTEVIDAAVEPTCTASGLTEGSHCAVCSAVITAQNEIPPYEHTKAVDAAVEPTCTKAGLTEGTHCAVCNAVITAQEEVPASGHTEAVDDAVEPTCMKTGLTAGLHCAVCGEVLTQQAIVPLAEHTVVIDEAVSATCEEEGLTEGSHCQVCGEIILKQEKTVPLGHKDILAAVMGTNGKQCIKCENCARVIDGGVSFDFTHFNDEIDVQAEFQSHLDAWNAIHEYRSTYEYDLDKYEKYTYFDETEDYSAVENYVSVDKNREFIKNECRTAGISKAAAISDVELMFLHLKRYYGLYEYFGGDAVFYQAREAIIEIIQNKETDRIYYDEFVQIIGENINFIEDGHFDFEGATLDETMGTLPRRFYVKGKYFYQTDSGFYTLINDERYYLLQIGTSTDIENWMKLSIDDDGRLCHIILFQDIEKNEKLTINEIALVNSQGQIVYENISWTTFGKRPFYEQYDGGILVKDNIPALISYTIDSAEDYALFEANGTTLLESNVVIIDSYDQDASQQAFLCKKGAFGRYSTIGLEKRGFELIKLGDIDSLIPNENKWFVVQDLSNRSGTGAFLLSFYEFENVITVGDNGAWAQLTGAAIPIVLPNSGIYLGCGSFFNIEAGLEQDNIGVEPSIYYEPTEAVEAIYRLCSYYGFTNDSNLEIADQYKLDEVLLKGRDYSVTTNSHMYFSESGLVIEEDLLPSKIITPDDYVKEILYTDECAALKVTTVDQRVIRVQLVNQYVQFEDADEGTWYNFRVKITDDDGNVVYEHNGPVRCGGSYWTISQVDGLLQDFRAELAPWGTMLYFIFREEYPLTANSYHITELGFERYDDVAVEYVNEIPYLEDGSKLPVNYKNPRIFEVMLVDQYIKTAESDEGKNYHFRVKITDDVGNVIYQHDGIICCGTTDWTITNVDDILENVRFFSSSWGTLMEFEVRENHQLPYGNYHVVELGFEPVS